MPVPDDIKDLLGGGENEAHWRKRLSDQGELKAPPRKSTWRRFMDSMEESMRRGPAGLITSVVAPLVETGDGKSYGERRADMAAKENQRRKDYDAVNAPEGIGELATDFGGAIAGSIISDPTNLVGGGAKTIGGKALNAAGVGAVADTALQGGEIAAGIRDEYDPVQGAVNVAAGPAFIGGIEFAKKIGNKFGTVTSTLRSPARNKKVGGAKNSHHLRGNAIDIARGKGVTHKQLENAYRRAGYDIIESLDEGDHSHFAFNFKGGKKSGGVVEDFDFRPPEQRAEIHDLLAGKDPVADFAPPLDSSHEKFTPYVERPNTPANEQDELDALLNEINPDRKYWEEEVNLRPEDVLTPAERQEIDASAVRPDIEPTTPKGLGKGSVATTPVNDLRAARRPETLPGNRDGSEDYPLPPGPNDPNFPKPGTPGNRGGPYGGDDTPIDPEKKLIDALKKAKPLNAEQRKAYHAERSKRSEMLQNIQRQGGSKRNYYAQLKSLKGDLPKVDYESIANDFTDADFDALLSKINFSNSLLPYEKVSAQTALMKMLGADGGKLPTAGEIKLLSEIFSRDLVEALLQNRSTIDKVWDGIANALNVPRSLMASFDLSAPFRQGVFMVGRKEFWKSWSTMFKAFGSDKAYEATMRSIHDRPTYQLMRKSGLSFSDAKSHILDEREEQFMSNWAEKIPVIGKGVEMSNRAYSAFLNKLRADVFDDLVRKGSDLGIDFNHNDKAAKDLAKFVNAGTGRGSLNQLAGKHGDAAAPFLSGLFFSPRLMASRLSMLNPYFYATLDPFVRKEAVKSLVTFAGIATTILGMAKMGGADVETDPRSSDFAKIKVGNTRYDVLGGFQQYLVALSRLSPEFLGGGKTKTLSGKIKKLDGTKFGQDSRYDVFLRFLRTKFSPVSAYVADAAAGENVIGEEFKPVKDALQSFVPLFAQDLVEVYMEEGFSPNLLSGVPAFFGVGVQTYEPKPTKKKNSQVPDDVKDLLGAK